MAKEKFEKALAEWPHTKMLKDGGIHIFGKYEQPGLESGMRFIWFIVCGTVLVWILVSTQNFIAAAVATGITIALYPLTVRNMMIGMFGKNVDVKIYSDKIQVRDGYRYKNYDRNMRIEFRVEEHQKGLQERAREIKYNKPQSRVYRESVEAVMQYGEKRVPIAEMPVQNVEKAKALLIRLQNICETFDDALRRMAEGQIRPAGTPAQTGPSEFGPAPKVR